MPLKYSRLLQCALAWWLTGLALLGLVDPRTGAARLRVDPSFEKLLPRDDEARQSYAAMQRRFGMGERVVVALEAPGGVFALDALEQILRVETRLLEFDEVAKVTSIATAPVLLDDDAGLLATPILEYLRETPEALDAVRAATLADPLYRGVLVSPDGRVAALHVALERVFPSSCRCCAISCSNCASCCQRGTPCFVPVWTSTCRAGSQA